MKILIFSIYIASVITHAVASQLDSVRYEGCYKVEQNLLIGDLVTNAEKNSPEWCATECHKKSYKTKAEADFKVSPFFGVRADTCFCFNNAELQAKYRLPGVACNTKCPGAPKMTCGGDNNVFDIYVHGTYNNSKGFEQRDASIVVTYNGCFNTDAGQTLLSETDFHTNSEISPKVCLEKCSLRGSTNAGLFNASKCQCFNSLPRTRLNDSFCQSTCHGSQLCGGKTATAVYSKKYFNASVFGKYHGQTTSTRLVQWVLNINGATSFEDCVQLCLQRGSIYAGSESTSRFCHCGNTYVGLTDDEASETKHHKIVVYETGILSDELKNYGCFQDWSQKRLLGGTIFIKKQDNTHESCSAVCKNFTFIFSGTEWGDRCYCGNTLSSKFLYYSDVYLHYSQLNESRCNSKCTGDNSTFCGGDSTINLRATGFSGEGKFNMGYIMHDSFKSLQSDSVRYEGCYKVEQNLLIGDLVTNAEKNSPEWCATECHKKSYKTKAEADFKVSPFFGVRADTCFCFNNAELNVKFRLPGVDCNTKCPGAPKMTCGGDNNVFDIYVHGTYNNSKGFEQRDASIVVTYDGCFETDADQTLLSETDFRTNSEVSPKVCLEECSLRGYTNAGVLDASKCQCFNTLPEKKLSDLLCQSACPGSQLCGRKTATAVYSKKHFDASVFGKYHGQTTSTRLVQWVLNINGATPSEDCVQLCLQKGSKYAGSESTSHLCHCGNTYVSSSDDEASGTENHKIVVYETGILSDKPKNYGCFQDWRQKRLLGGDLFIKLDNTHESCAAECKKLLFVFSGTEWGDRCYCGNTLSSKFLYYSDVYLHYSQLDESRCNSKCSGDDSTFCGGDSTVNVRATGLSGEGKLNLGYNMHGSFKYTGLYTRHIGCSQKQTSPVLADETTVNLEDNSKTACIKYCSEHGFGFAGVQDSTRCSCGNNVTQSYVKVDDSNCNAKCSGDYGLQTCVAPNTINIYKIGYSTLEQLPANEIEQPPKAAPKKPALNTQLTFIIY